MFYVSFFRGWGDFSFVFFALPRLHPAGAERRRKHGEEDQPQMDTNERESRIRLLLRPTACEQLPIGRRFMFALIRVHSWLIRFSSCPSGEIYFFCRSCSTSSRRDSPALTFLVRALNRFHQSP